MPTQPPEIDSAPEPRAPEASPGTAAVGQDTPLSFVPHTETGAVDPTQQRFRTTRYGDRDVSELVKILDSVEDERARARFRESIYISVFVWLAVVALLVWGPKYLWHAAQIKSVSGTIREHELMTLNAPRLPHVPTVKPPTVDAKTLSHLRDTERIRRPAPQPENHPAPESHPASQPVPATTAPTPPPVTPRANPPLPSAPQPTRTAPSTAVPDAPAPQPSSNPFSLSRKPDYASNPVSHGAAISSVPLHGGGGGSMGSGAQILSDTQGVDFSEWTRRFVRQTQAVWEPMLPEEIYPPLNKRGTTAIDITIGPDGTILHMGLAGSTHDEALNRAAWGSITSQGKLLPLPKDFHGPNIVIRCFFVVEDR